MTDSSSARNQGSQPAAIIFGPAMPTNRAPGTCCLSASMSPAPSVSPDCSPAASAIRNSPVTRALPLGSAREAARAVLQRVEEHLELGLIDHELLDDPNRLVELERLA